MTEEKKKDENTKLLSVESIKELTHGVTVSRLTVPNDANVYGNVHGGSTLKLLEEAGIIVSTKFCNYAFQKDKKDVRVFTTLARIESVDFLQPLKIGEVVEVKADILYASTTSILVEAKAYAVDILHAPELKRNTNRAWLWYVAWDEDEKEVMIPQMAFQDSQEQQRVLAKYSSVIKGDPTLSTSTIATFHNNLSKEPHEMLQGGRNGFEAKMKKCLSSLSSMPTAHSPASSESCLSMTIGVNDVAFGGSICKGGVLLKLMDECAGVVAAKHCRSNVVTACMDATNFYSKLRRGQLLTIHGKTTFTSSKSMEVEVEVWVDDPFNHSETIERPFKAADAFFTYVSIGSDGKPKDIPQLVISSDEERESFEAGKVRYSRRKEHRKKLQA